MTFENEITQMAYDISLGDLPRRWTKSDTAFVATVICGIASVLAAPVAFMTAAMTLIDIAFNADDMNALNSALAAGKEIVEVRISPLTPGIESYAIRCTGPGQANAFRIESDRLGDKDDPLLGRPDRLFSRFVAHSVPAKRCDGGVN